MAASQSFTVLSSLALATIRLLGSKSTALTGRAWPLNTVRQLPVAASHSRIVLSSDGEASICPSGDHEIRPIASSCPLNVRTSFTPGGSGRRGLRLTALGVRWIDWSAAIVNVYSRCRLTFVARPPLLHTGVAQSCRSGESLVRYTLRSRQPASGTEAHL